VQRALSECYQTLEVEPGASLEDIKQAYRQMARVWHPDRFPNDPKLQAKAQEKLKQINLAYEQICRRGVYGPPRHPKQSTSVAASGKDTESSASGNKRSWAQYAAIGVVIIAVVVFALLGARRSYNREGASHPPAPHIEIPPSESPPLELQQSGRVAEMDTALSHELNAEQKSLEGRVNDQQRAETATRDQQRKKLLEKEAPAWNAAVANYRQKIAIFDFTGALDAINAAKVSEPSLREAQAGLQKKARWLIEWKNKLMDDLNRTHFSGAIAEGGAQYTGIDGANVQKLSLKNPYGSAQFPWTKLTPKTLFSVSTTFIQPNAPDAADREWLSAVFAAETGDSKAASEMAEKAAAAKPAYRNQSSLLWNTLRQ